MRLDSPASGRGDAVFRAWGVVSFVENDPGSDENNNQRTRFHDKVRRQLDSKAIVVSMGRGRSAAAIESDVATRPALSWKRDDEGGYKDADGRYTIARAYKRPNRYDTRNTTNHIPDGFVLSDAVTGMQRRFDTLAEAKRYATRWREVEAGLDFNKIRFWQARFPGGILGVEVRGVDRNGKDAGITMTLLGTPAGASNAKKEEAAREHLASWLELIGRPELREYTG